MESFPGAFPGIYPRNETTDVNSISSPLIQNATSNNISPDLIHVQKSLTHKRKVFKEDLIFKLDCATYAYFFITYLFDCSLLLLTLKVLIQSSILIFYWSPDLQNVITSDSKANYKRSTLHGIVLVNSFSVLLHIIRNLPIPNDDGYIYGHHTLQVIGQYQLSNKYWLLAFDAACFFLQVLVYSTQSAIRKNDKATLRSSRLEEEYDGIQGRTIAAKLGFVDALKPPFASIDELKASEATRESGEGIFDFLRSNEYSQNQYGATDPVAVPVGSTVT